MIQPVVCEFRAPRNEQCALYGRALLPIRQLIANAAEGGTSELSLPNSIMRFERRFYDLSTNEETTTNSLSWKDERLHCVRDRADAYRRIAALPGRAHTPRP